MARLTREESRALTRSKLLASAGVVVGRDGYEAASIDRIADEAGFSKGAFYSNFASKEEIVLELLETHSLKDVAEIAALIGESRDPAHMIEVISEWAQQRSVDPSWGMAALELFRRARRDQTFSARHTKLFRAQWRGLGEILLSLFPDGQAPADAEVLGGVVFELTYGVAAPFMDGPTTRDLIRFVLVSMNRAYGKQPDAVPVKKPAPARRSASVSARRAATPARKRVAA